MALSPVLTGFKAGIGLVILLDQVAIIGVFYGGQDYETALQDDLEEGK